MHFKTSKKSIWPQSGENVWLRVCWGTNELFFPFWPQSGKELLVKYSPVCMSTSSAARVCKHKLILETYKLQFSYCRNNGFNTNTLDLWSPPSKWRMKSFIKWKWKVKTVMVFNQSGDKLCQLWIIPTTQYEEVKDQWSTLYESKWNKKKSW